MPGARHHKYRRFFKKFWLKYEQPPVPVIVTASFHGAVMRADFHM